MLLFDPQAPCLAAFGSNENPAPPAGFFVSGKDRRLHRKE